MQKCRVYTFPRSVLVEIKPQEGAARYGQGFSTPCTERTAGRATPS